MSESVSGVRSRKDRFIAKLISAINRALYRDVEVFWTEPIEGDNPQLSVANHFGGLSDALVLVGVMPRRPGIVARDVIWKVPLVGSLMNWIGGIPVHKAEDRGSATSNDEMFASCYRALESGGNILIFPEGVTRNEPSMAEVKTGAARIAIGARAHGTADVRIIPMGIHYEDKAALRSRVFVNVGVPIDLDDVMGAVEGPGETVTANDRDEVNALTETIDVALRRVAPDFSDWNEAGLLAKGAEITLRSQLDDPAGDVPPGLRDRLANTLADRPDEERATICSAVSDYRGDLDALGATDAELNGRMNTGTFVRTLIWEIVIGALLLPFVAVGVVINAIPFLVVKAVGLFRVAPSMLSSVKPIVAGVAYGIAWGLVIWWAITQFGWEAGVAAFVLLPVYFTACVLFIERFTLMWRAFRRWRASGAAKRLDEQIAERRAAVVEAVLGA